MVLKDVFDALQSGEIRLTHLVETGFDDLEVRRKLLNLVTRGLTELHTRFKIREDVAEVVLQDGVNQYTLDSLVAPRLLKVTAVYTEDGLSARYYPLNQTTNESFRTPTYDTLVLPRALDPRPASVFVEYRQNHPALSEDALYDMPENIMLYLPEPFLEPLVLYVAAKVHAGNGAADGIDLAPQFQTQYEVACQKLEMYNVDGDTLETPDVFLENGWV